MVEFVSGDILKVDAEAIVNTVNTKGVMGKGIALQFKKAFPEMFAAYKKEAQAGKILVGHMQVYEQPEILGPKFIINFPTKNDWRKPSKIEFIKEGLDDLVKVIREYRISSIAIPPLGCGQGGLNWADVAPLIEFALKQVPEVKTFVFQPLGAPKPSEMINRTERPKLTLSRAVVLKLLKQYCVLGYELTLLETQKLLYFLQEAGEPLKLKFQKQIYGPYADNLRHVLSLFEGHFTEGFGDGQNKPDTQIKILPGAMEEATDYLKDQENNSHIIRLAKVEELIEGFESPYGMELLSTVHWVVAKDSVSSENTDAVISAVQGWNTRKKALMKPEHIKIALTQLKEKNWV